MSRPWLSLVLGAVCLIAWFVFGYIISETFRVLSVEQDIQYARTIMPVFWAGLGVSLGSVMLGLRVRAACDPGNREGRATGGLGAALALLATMLWLIGALFLPYRT